MNCSKRRLMCLFLGLLATRVAAGGAAPDLAPLEPEQAFRLAAAREENGDIQLSFMIANGHYLYRDRFKLTQGGKEIARTVLKWPTGKVLQDPTFGKVTVYRDSVRLLVPANLLAGSVKGGEVELAVISQGCADAGICYPPQRQTITFAAGDRIPKMSVSELGFSHSGAVPSSLTSTLAKKR